MGRTKKWEGGVGARFAKTGTKEAGWMLGQEKPEETEEPRGGVGVTGQTARL